MNLTPHTARTRHLRPHALQILTTLLLIAAAASSAAGQAASTTATPAPAAPAPATPAPATNVSAAPVQVMILGTFHMANPGQDLHDLHVDDVLAPARQQELATLARDLSRFHPNRVAVEWPADVVADRYPKFLAGTLPPSHNEVVQVGFRLAKLAHADGVYAIDADGDFPYQRLVDFAQFHGDKPLLDRLDREGTQRVATLQKTLDTAGILPTLRTLNTTAQIDADQTFYSSLLFIGTGSDQPGADLLSSWYHRNALICANLLQLSRPGDRIVVLFGAGHAFYLRQCVATTPGFQLVEPNEYLKP